MRQKQGVISPDAGVDLVLVVAAGRAVRMGQLGCHEGFRSCGNYSPASNNLTRVSQSGKRKHVRRSPRRLLGGALVRVAAKVDPGALRAAVRAAAKVDPGALRAAVANLPAPGPPAGRPREGACRASLSPGVSRRQVQYLDNAALTKTVNLCDDCGYLAIDEMGASHHRAATSLDELPNCERIGNTERPGREFQMARMALQILGRKGGQDVLVYGAGRSLDNVDIERLRRAGTVSIADIMKVRDDAPFIDVNDPGEQRFPVVVASEVLEHFRDPWSDFATLLGMVDPGACWSAGPTSTTVVPTWSTTATSTTETTRRTTRWSRSAG